MSVPANVEQNPAAEGQDTGELRQAGANPDTASQSDPTQASSAASEEPESRSIDYFRQAFARTRGFNTETHSLSPQAPPASPGPVQESERSEGEQPPEVQPSAEETTARPPAKPRRTEQDSQPPDQITLTQAELDRRIQAEADRIMAKRQRDDEAKRQKQEELELRRYDPAGYVRHLDEKEAAEAAERAKVEDLTTQLNSQIIEFDRNVLDPFVASLPDDIRANVIQAAATIPGLDGRKIIAQETLKALREHWLAEGAKTARPRLLQDEGFRKEMFARYGGQRTEPEPAQPSLPVSSDSRPTNGDAANNARMDSWIRTSAQAMRQTTR